MLTYGKAENGFYFFIRNIRERRIAMAFMLGDIIVDRVQYAYGEKLDGTPCFIDYSGYYG